MGAPGLWESGLPSYLDLCTASLCPANFKEGSVSSLTKMGVWKDGREQQSGGLQLSIDRLDFSVLDKLYKRRFYLYLPEIFGRHENILWCRTTVCGLCGSFWTNPKGDQLLG